MTRRIHTSQIEPIQAMGAPFPQGRWRHSILHLKSCTHGRFRLHFVDECRDRGLAGSVFSFSFSDVTYGARSRESWTVLSRTRTFWSQSCEQALADPFSSSPRGHFSPPLLCSLCPLPTWVRQWSDADQQRVVHDLQLTQKLRIAINLIYESVLLISKPQLYAAVE